MYDQSEEMQEMHKGDTYFYTSGIQYNLNQKTDPFQLELCHLIKQHVYTRVHGRSDCMEH